MAQKIPHLRENFIYVSSVSLKLGQGTKSNKLLVCHNDILMQVRRNPSTSSDYIILTRL